MAAFPSSEFSKGPEGMQVHKRGLDGERISVLLEKL